MSLEKQGLSVAEAVRKAKEHFNEVFADEQAFNIGLEEVDFNPESSEWLITLGFSRPWNSTRNVITAISGDNAVKRAFRTVKMSNDGELLSVKRRTNDEA